MSASISNLTPTRRITTGGPSLGGNSSQDLIVLCKADLRRDNLGGFVFSHYRLGKRIGSGGMGQVFEATHLQLGKLFAIKFMGSEAVCNPEAGLRFVQEIAANGRMSHSNIVAAVDAGCLHDIHFLVTELLDGADLASWIQSRPVPPIGAACEMIRQVAFGLSHAHSQGFTHRDIKPSNIFLQKDGCVKILDFGLARHESSRGGVTNQGQVIGTIDYLSPEQLENASDIEPSSDIYSLGCTFLHLLSGAPPFPDSTHPSTMKKIKGHLADIPPCFRSISQSIPKPIADLIGRMIEKRVENRIRNGLEIAETLSSFSNPFELLAWMGDGQTGSARLGSLASKTASQFQCSEKTYLQTKKFVFARPAATLLGCFVLIMVAYCMWTSWFSIRSSQAQLNNSSPVPSGRLTSAAASAETIDRSKPFSNSRVEHPKSVTVEHRNAKPMHVHIPSKPYRLNQSLTQFPLTTKSE